MFLQKQIQSLELRIQAANRAKNKAQIGEAWRQIEALFLQFENDPVMVNLVCDWIAGSDIGSATRTAQDAVDQIGSGGDPIKLKQACDVWVNAWRHAVDNWHQANGNPRLSRDR